MTSSSTAPDTRMRNPPRKPKASVVMTVYDDLRFLDAAIDSVLKQDFADLELIVVDDGNEVSLGSLFSCASCS